MICADFQSLISSHNQSSLAILLVLQQPNITSSTLLPLIAVFDELEELSTHLENLLLELLIGLDVDFLREADNGLEVDIF